MAGWAAQTLDDPTAYATTILAGFFEKYPKLNIFAGHWGEMVPFFLASATGSPRSITETFHHHVYVTASVHPSSSHARRPLSTRRQHVPRSVIGGRSAFRRCGET